MVMRLATICAVRRRLWDAKRFALLQRATRPLAYWPCPTDRWVKA